MKKSLRVCGVLGISIGLVLSSCANNPENAKAAQPEEVRYQLTLAGEEIAQLNLQGSVNVDIQVPPPPSVELNLNADVNLGGGGAQADVNVDAVPPAPPALNLDLNVEAQVPPPPSVNIDANINLGTGGVQAEGNLSFNAESTPEPLPLDPEQKALQRIAAAEQWLADEDYEAGARLTFPVQYEEAKDLVREARRLRNQKKWDEAFAKADQVFTIWYAQIQILKGDPAFVSVVTPSSRARGPQDREGTTEAANNAANMSSRTASNPTDTAAATVVAAATDPAQIQQQNQAADAIQKAYTDLTWAASADVDAIIKYPNQYNEASSAYNEALKAQSANNYSAALASAAAVTSAVDSIRQLQEKAQSDAKTAQNQALLASADTALRQIDDSLAWGDPDKAAEKNPDLYNQALTSYTAAEAARESGDAEGAKANADAAIATVADIALDQAVDQLAWADGIGASEKYPELYNQADASLDAGFNTADVQNKLDNAKAAIAKVDEIKTLERTAAADSLEQAKVRLDWAKAIKADVNYSDLYTEASTSYNDAQEALGTDDFAIAKLKAGDTVAAVAQIEAGYRQAQTPLAPPPVIAQTGNSAANMSSRGALNPADIAAAAEAARQQQNQEQNQGGQPPAQDGTSAAAQGGTQSSSADKNQQQIGAAQPQQPTQPVDNTALAQQATGILEKAKEALDWADGNQVGQNADYVPIYNQATTAYSGAVRAQNARQYVITIVSANTVIRAIEQIRQRVEAKSANEQKDPE